MSADLMGGAPTAAGAPRGGRAKRVVFIAAIVLVAAAGVYLGSIARHVTTPRPEADLTLTPPPHLAVGSSFPDVSLLGADSAGATSRGLLGTTGGVVIFLEIGCHPCSLMTARWEASIRDGSLTDLPVFCITSAPVPRIRDYAVANGLTIPIYSDPAARFETEHGVSSFPIRLVVDRSMTVRAFTYDSEEPVDPEGLLALLFPE